MRIRLILLWMLLSSAVPAIGQVSIGIGFPNLSIGINVPLYPELVPVPGYPVYYAPGLNSNYFFYDGMYWVYQSDNWYASSWYNGPWGLVAAEDVPANVLLVPVRYYRQPPEFFIGWQPEAPPRWGEHWGREWQRRRAGWDHWDRNSAPAPAPLPVYQRQYSGDRYPRGEQQHALQSQNERYQPRDPGVRRLYEAQQGSSAPSSARRETQARPQAANPGPSGTQRSPASVQQSEAVVPRGRGQQGADENTPRSPLTLAPPQMERPPVQRRQQAPVQRQQPAPTPRGQQAGPQANGPSLETRRSQEPGQHPPQAVAEHQQPAPSSRSQETAPQGKAGSQEAKRAQEPVPEKGREKADDRGQEHR